MKYSFLPLFIILFSIISCGKEKFATKKVLNVYNAPITEFMKYEGKNLSAFGTVPPKVDFLFLWDNSSSFLLNSDATKDALAGTISRISREFDYRIILSPLIPKKNDLSESYIVSKTTGFIPSTLLSRWSPPDGRMAWFSVADSGSFEEGISRAHELTTLGYKFGIFRQKANMIIVLLSNGDDNSWGGLSGPRQENYVSTWTQEFINLKSSQDLENFKFLSVVPHTICKGSRPGSTYKMMSANFSNSKTGDSYDFCNIQSFYRLFDEINEAIKVVKVPYTYLYWPFYPDQYGKFDTTKVKVQVRKETGEIENPSLNYSLTDGYSFYPKNPVESPDNLMIIKCPINPYDGKPYPEINCEKERYSGYFIQLNGNAKITWPNYIDVITQTQLEYFGYVRLNFKPFIDPNKKLSDSIRLKIRDKQVPEGGFEYIPERTTRNIKIKGPDPIPYGPVDFSEGHDPERPFEGYFLKLAPEWIYKSNESVQVDYWPAGT